jgi:hypothetical protein
MLFHIVIILLITIIGILLSKYSSYKSSKIFYLIYVFLILFFISGFKSIHIGNDTAYYVELFNYYGSVLGSMKNIDFNLGYLVNSRIEIGYTLLNLVLYSISSNYLILFISTSAFILSVWLYHIKKNSKIIWLSVFVFINLRFFYFTLSGLRQAIAMSFVLLSFRYLKKRKFLMFIIIVLIASLFHLSALVFIIAYPISFFKFNYKYIFLSFFISIIFYTCFDKILQIFLYLFPKYKMYLTSIYFNSQIKLANIINTLLVFIILIFGIIIKNKKLFLSNESNQENIIYHIMNLALLFSLISLKISILGRFTMYFFMFSCIYIPNTIMKINSNRNRVIITSIIVNILFIYNMIILYARPDWQHIYPFEFYWMRK